MKSFEFHRLFQVEQTHWWYRALDELVLASLHRWAPKTDARILDAGCGTGRVLSLLTSYAKVEGVEQSADGIAYCRQRGRLTVRQGDLNTAPLDENSFDAIISLDVLCHSSIKDDKAVLSKFHRALKDRGILLLNLPAFDLLQRRHDRQVSNVRRYHRELMNKILRDMGYHIVVSTYRLSFLWLPMFVKKLVEPRNSENSDLRPVSSIINRSLLALASAENKAILNGMSFPFGTSLWIVAQKKS